MRRTMGFAAIAVLCVCMTLARAAQGNQPDGTMRLSGGAVPNTVPVVGGVVDAKRTAVTATVHGIDSETGRIMLRRRDGSELTIVIPSEVADLEQAVDEGDQIRLTSRELVAFEIKKSNQVRSGVTYEKDVTRAPRDGRLGACGTDTVQVRATIAAVEDDLAAVIVRSPQGDLALVELPGHRALDTIAIGDVIAITHTTAFCITISKATH